MYAVLEKLDNIEAMLSHENTYRGSRPIVMPSVPSAVKRAHADLDSEVAEICTDAAVVLKKKNKFKGVMEKLVVSVKNQYLEHTEVIYTKDGTKKSKLWEQAYAKSKRLFGEESTDEQTRVLKRFFELPRVRAEFVKYLLENKQDLIQAMLLNEVFGNGAPQ